MLDSRHMRVLAVETSSLAGGVALLDDDRLVAEYLLDVSVTHSERLLSAVDRVLGDARWTPRELTGLAVAIGPGSFTGLRVGMSVAKGLAVALDRPIIGVPSLPAWLESEPEAAAAVARAGARDAYLLRRGTTSPEIVDRDLLGDVAGPYVAPAELVEAFALADAVQPLRAAAAVARQAALRLRDEPAGDDLSLLEPAYLRAPRGVPQTAADGR